MCIFKKKKKKAKKTPVGAPSPRRGNRYRKPTGYTPASTTYQQDDDCGTASHDSDSCCGITSSDSESGSCCGE